MADVEKAAGAAAKDGHTEADGFAAVLGTLAQASTSACDVTHLT